jgi:hypothetical protein
VDQVGRKSGESLAVVVTLPGQRPEPAESLGPKERVIWKRVVSAHPHDWFISSTHCLLADYCRSWVKSEEIAEALGKYDGVPDGDEFRRYDKILGRQDKVARLLATLGTKLRITPHAMRSEREAATGVRRTMQSGKKPWETE